MKDFYLFMGIKNMDTTIKFDKLQIEVKKKKY